jgi:hypothetical protein
LRDEGDESDAANEAGAKDPFDIPDVPPARVAA